MTTTVPAGATSGQLRVQTASSGDVLSAGTLTVAAAPSPVVARPYVIGDRVLTLSWTGGGTGPSVVRDVTGLSGVVTPASGRGIPVVGHVGLRPQAVNVDGAFKAKGRSEGERARVVAEAEATADAMCRQLLANPVVEEYAVTVGRPRSRR